MAKDTLAPLGEGALGLLRADRDAVWVADRESPSTSTWLDIRTPIQLHGFEREAQMTGRMPLWWTR